jgi:hypothetical protein
MFSAKGFHGTEKFAKFAAINNCRRLETFA